jgi:hypothetical protein
MKLECSGKRLDFRSGQAEPLDCDIPGTKASYTIRADEWPQKNTKR